MEPGRELDALVAGKVMGWRTEYDHSGPRFVPPVGSDHYITEESDAGRRYYLPHYSTEIEDAWEVVEHMGKTEHFEVEINRFDLESGYYIQFGTADMAQAATAPHAICLAALAAVGAEAPA